MGSSILCLLPVDEVPPELSIQTWAKLVPVASCKWTVTLVGNCENFLLQERRGEKG